MTLLLFLQLPLAKGKGKGHIADLRDEVLESLSLPFGILLKVALAAKKTPHGHLCGLAALKTKAGSKRGHIDSFTSSYILAALISEIKI